MYTKQNALSFFSQSGTHSMVNVFDDSIASGPGNLQVVKKVVVTEGKDMAATVWKGLRDRAETAY